MCTRNYGAAQVDVLPEVIAPGVFRLELTLTFPAERDPFAFDLENEPTVLVAFRGKNIIRTTNPVQAGTSLQVQPLQHVVEGNDEQSGGNEFYFEILAGEDSSVARGVRFRIFRDEQVVVDRTAWSHPGEPVRGTVNLVILAPPETEHAPEDHSIDRD
jgi:hypothetical protein